MIDNYDSFVYNLVRYFEELEEELEVVRNDKININNIDLNKYSLHQLLHHHNNLKYIILYIFCLHL